MQTFLPYASFARSAATLDRVRLGKQRVETLQVQRALTVPGYGWRHHPAALMWRGYEEALACYGVAICREWISRGYADTCLDKIVTQAGRVPRRQPALRRAGLLPPWLGHRAFHLSHRSSLLRKDPAHYESLFPGVRRDLDYVWPVAQAVARPPA